MLKEEIKKIIYRKQFIFVFLTFFAAAVIDFLMTCRHYYGVELSWVRSAYKCGILTNETRGFTAQLFHTLLPLMICVGVSDVFYTEKTRGITNFIHSRTTAKRNIQTKAAAVGLVSFFMAWIPLSINFLLTFTAFPLQGFYCTNASYLTLTCPEEGRIFGYLEMFYPYCNCIVYILIRCFIGSSFALFSFALSVLNHFNRYVILLSGMVYYLCYSSVTGLPAFCDTVINTDIFAINSYGSGGMILVFVLFSLVLSALMISVGMKKETY